MYKVFINEKKLSFSNSPEDVDKNLKYVNSSTFEEAVDLLENTSAATVHIFSNDIEHTWKKFGDYYKNIEAAGGIVLNSREEVLFIFRLGRWDLPKGKMEKGESRETTAIREVQEECSISGLTIDHFINSTYHMYTARNGNKILKIVHWFRMRHKGDEMPTPQTIEGITKAEWLPQDQIKATVYPSTFRNIKLILDEGLDLD